MVQTLGCGSNVGFPRSSSTPPSLGRGRVVPPPPNTDSWFYTNFHRKFFRPPRSNSNFCFCLFIKTHHALTRISGKRFFLIAHSITLHGTLSNALSKSTKHYTFFFLSLDVLLATFVLRIRHPLFLFRA